MTKPKITEAEFRGIKYKFYDYDDTLGVLGDHYKTFQKGITFYDDDNIVDIGANQAVFSIMMAKEFPKVKIYGYEPVTETYHKALANIELNEVTNIEMFNLGVTGDGRDITMSWVPSWSGGGTMYMKDRTDEHSVQYNVHTVTLDDIIRKLRRIRLLKFDCEAAEYEIFYASKLLDRVDMAVGEIHHDWRDTGWKPVYKNQKYDDADIHKLATYINSKTRLRYYVKCG
jgi:FkbM family methyltransferase